jgi:FkbM family methyltransferase
MLLASVQRLGLEQTIEPIPAAVLDQAGKARLKCLNRNSLLGRVVPENEPLESADTVTVQAITLDAFCKTRGTVPSLLKIDVEGAEPAVLRGARDLLTTHRPAIVFEYNPSCSRNEITTLLHTGPLDRYLLYYVDDLEGQLLPFGSAVDSFEDISWVCNLFAVPEECLDRWFATIDKARERI